MSRKPIGDAAMTDAQRQKRRRDKAKALRVQRTRTPSPVAPDLLALDAETIAAHIHATVPVDKAINIASALQRRLWQGGSWPPWMPPILS